jgi:hypothetical protein
MNKDKLKHYASRVKTEALGLDRRVLARVAGVTFEGRQKWLEEITLDTEVCLERDRRNPYDFNAVKVLAHLNGDWQHVGFIPSTMSKLISTSLDNGVELDAIVHRRTGGMVNEHTGEQFNYGLELKITPPGFDR